MVALFCRNPEKLSIQQLEFGVDFSHLRDTGKVRCLWKCFGDLAVTLISAGMQTKHRMSRKNTRFSFLHLQENLTVL